MPKRSMPVITIGSRESVDFPEFELLGVPAKVDTGADSSAIWASNIREVHGTLQFCLFDAASPFYTGRTVTAIKYGVTSVKNSFGHVEHRYKVPLKVTIAGRTINVRFTLANRENNRYPILIGRRTLSGKFLVDVARAQDRREPYRMLLLTIRRTPRIESFVTSLNQANDNLQVTLGVYDELQFSIGETCRVTLGEGDDIAHFDFVHFKATPLRRQDIAAAAACYLKKRNVPYADQAVAAFAAHSKLYQYVVLHDNDIMVPSSVFVAPEKLPRSFDAFAQALGVPFVLKDIHGSRGRANYLITNQREFKAAVQHVHEAELQVIAQQFIDNEGDYRLLSFGRKISLVMFRQRQTENTHLNNISQGGRATLVGLADIPAEVQEESLRAARLLNREIAGVDMVQDKQTGIWYCLEVNDDPQISSGAFIDEKRAAYGAYIESEIEK